MDIWKIDQWQQQWPLSHLNTQIKINVFSIRIQDNGHCLVLHNRGHKSHEILIFVCLKQRQNNAVTKLGRTHWSMTAFLGIFFEKNKLIRTIEYNRALWHHNLVSFRRQTSKSCDTEISYFFLKDSQKETVWNHWPLPKQLNIPQNGVTGGA